MNEDSLAAEVRDGVEDFTSTDGRKGLGSGERKGQCERCAFGSSHAAENELGLEGEEASAGLGRPAGRPVGHLD